MIYQPHCKKCGEKYPPDSLIIFAKIGDLFCPKCDKEKFSRENPSITKKSLKPFQKKDFKVCDKGCGAEIYFDSDHKTENSVWIPFDRHTRRPHDCKASQFSQHQPTPSKSWHIEGGPGGDTMEYTGKTEEITNTSPTGDKPESKEEQQIGIPETLWYDLNEIPSDPIIDKIKEGQKEKKLAIIHYEHDEQPEPETIALTDLSSKLFKGLLRGLGTKFPRGLLKFQDDTITTILSGKKNTEKMIFHNTVISAPTGSGKTEAFIIPIIQKIHEKAYPHEVFAVLVYPTRPLASDQTRKINELIRACGLGREIEVIPILGGITATDVASRKELIKRKCVIVATNFDFINYHLTLQDDKWKTFVEPAKVIILDELHSYTSFHGSNVYHIIKRMKKYMTNVHFIGSSATLVNAQEFFENICSLPKDSSEYVSSIIGRERDVHRFFIMPDNQRAMMQKISVTCFLEQPDRNNKDEKGRQLIFSNTHNDAEILAMNIKKASKQRMKIKVHRGGLSQGKRTDAELELKNGYIDAVSCTPTLELGIDIGAIDVAISAFTSKHDSFIQRSGRAGRNGKKSYTFCVFDPNDAGCYYYSRNIDDYIDQEHKIEISTDNPIISSKHREAKKVEMDCKIGGKDYHNKKKYMTSSYELILPETGKMSIRGSAGKVLIYHGGKKVAERVAPVGYYQLHKNALYLMDSELYEVDSLKKEGDSMKADLKKSVEENQATKAIVRVVLTKPLTSSNDREYGKISLFRTITGYYKGIAGTNVMEWDKYDFDEDTDGKNFTWYSNHMAVKIIVPPKFADDAGTEDPRIHTIVHVLANAAKIVAKCEAIDMDVIYYSGSIYIYDNTNDGVNGVSQMIYENYEKILETSRKLLDDCDCDKRKNPESGGCPRCIFTTGSCLTNNKELDKKRAREFFNTL